LFAGKPLSADQMGVGGNRVCRRCGLGAFHRPTLHKASRLFDACSKRHGPSDLRARRKRAAATNKKRRNCYLSRAAITGSRTQSGSSAISMSMTVNPTGCL